MSAPNDTAAGIPFDETEIKQVLYRYKDLLARVAFHAMKNAADTEDVVQDVLLQWLRRRPNFASEEHRKAWLIRVTIHQCHRRATSAWRRRVTLSGEEIRPLSPPVPERSHDLWEAVMALPENQRMVVYLHHYEGYSLKEIADLMGRNSNTVQSWHTRALAALRKELTTS